MITIEHMRKLAAHISQFAEQPDFIVCSPEISEDIAYLHFHDKPYEAVRLLYNMGKRGVDLRPRKYR